MKITLVLNSFYDILRKNCGVLNFFYYISVTEFILFAKGQTLKPVFDSSVRLFYNGPYEKAFGNFCYPVHRFGMECCAKQRTRYY